MNFATAWFHLRSLWSVGRRHGLEGLFDAAATNALLVFAGNAGIDTRTGHGKGRLLSAKGLLDELSERHGEGSDEDIVLSAPNPRCGVPAISDVDEPEAISVTIRVGALREAIETTQKPRHGRVETSPLSEIAMEALGELAEHPALRIVSDEEEDAFHVDQEQADALERGRAVDYWRSLDQSERDRRTSLANNGIDPSTHEPLYAHCPVCEHQTMNIAGYDAFGFGIAYGTCLACSYTRSSYDAHQEAIETKLGGN